MPTISEDVIRKKAYEIWKARGDNNGSAENDWKQAEIILEQELLSSSQILRRVSRILRQSVVWLSAFGSDLKSNSGGYRLEFWIALLTLLGSTTGGFLGSYLESSQWQTRVQYEAKTQVLNERIKLIERTANLLTKASRAATLNTLIEGNLKTASRASEICIALVKEIKEGDFCENLEELVEHIPEYNLELVNLTSDLSATMSLNSLYFCSETRKIITEFSNSSSWWEVSQKTKQKLLNTMSSELQCSPL